MGIGRKKKNKEELLEIFKKTHKNKYNYSLVEETGSKVKIKIICPRHGVFEQLPYSHYKSGCPKCADIKHSNFLTKKYSLNEVEKKVSPFLLTGNKKPNYYLDDFIEVTCNIHSSVTVLKVQKLFTKKLLCKKCNFKPRKNRLKFSTFLENTAKIFPTNLYQFSLIQPDFLGQSEVKVSCKKHGISVRKAANIVHNKVACLKCGHSISHGEMEIMRVLESERINYKFQKVFNELKLDKNCYLRFDFFIEEFNLIIEFDGAQHFTPSFRSKKTWFETIDSFAKARISDLIKDHYCCYKGISLLRISYKDLKNIEKIIKREINEQRTDYWKKDIIESEKENKRA